MGLRLIPPQWPCLTPHWPITSQHFIILSHIKTSNPHTSLCGHRAQLLPTTPPSKESSRSPWLYVDNDGIHLCQSGWAAHKESQTPSRLLHQCIYVQREYSSQRRPDIRALVDSGALWVNSRADVVRRDCHHSGQCKQGIGLKLAHTQLEGTAGWWGHIKLYTGAYIN